MEDLIASFNKFTNTNFQWKHNRSNPCLDGELIRLKITTNQVNELMNRVPVDLWLVIGYIVGELYIRSRDCITIHNSLEFSKPQLLELSFTYTELRKVVIELGHWEMGALKLTKDGLVTRFNEGLAVLLPNEIITQCKIEPFTVTIPAEQVAIIFNYLESSFPVVFPTKCQVDAKLAKYLQKITKSYDCKWTGIAGIRVSMNENQMISNKLFQFLESFGIEVNTRRNGYVAELINIEQVYRKLWDQEMIPYYLEISNQLYHHIQIKDLVLSIREYL